MAAEIVTNEQLNFSVDYQPTKIVINNQDKLERALKAYINKYSGLVVSEQTLPDDKKVKRELNSLKKQLNDKRIEIHKTFDQPYIDFKTSIDGMLSQIDEVVNPIDEGISKFEEQQKQQRLEDVKAEIAEMAPNYNVKPDEIEIDDSWLNKSLSKIKRTKVIADRMKYAQAQKKALNNSITAATEHAKSVGVEPDGWVEQLKQGQDLDWVIQAIDHSVEERAKKAAYNKTMEDFNAEQHGETTIDANTGEIRDEDMTYVLKLTGTKAELTAVRKFLDNSQIRWEKVE
ncbi:DUF1351 domain-containing protein [Pediococcus inopinatus]|uniref:DUF1351 domain-containing protein n=1 Tax=Pediococcus inopinatus TaxID=114090 RepID=UPI0007C5D90E|nr:DUF1351 domain-containing protein [Pediococcus inopinatus]